MNAERYPLTGTRRGDREIHVLSAWQRELQADVDNRTDRAHERLDRWRDVRDGGADRWRTHASVLAHAAEVILHDLAFADEVAS